MNNSRKVYWIDDFCLTPLAAGTKANFAALKQGKTAVFQRSLNHVWHEAFFASAFENRSSLQLEGFTFAESIMYQSLLPITQGKDLSKSVLIVSTTKGNVEELARLNPKRYLLDEMAQFVAKKIGFKHPAKVVCNACISGVMAISIAQKLIASSRFNEVYICGVDTLSEFVVSGFQSFKAISHERCKPFDKNRVGINIGEAAVSVHLSANPAEIIVQKGAISNDANHISGPSRTGDGLSIAIKNCLADSDFTPDFISAHGTATLYNDEMESKALNACNLQDVPVNSFKAYYGHTLGAAGLLEAALSVQSMRENFLIKSLGFEEQGTEQAIQVITESKSHSIKQVLKVASGFGGCNAAISFSKES